MNTDYYGGCGIERCLDCRPIFDADNAEIPDTDDDSLPQAALLKIVHDHVDRKFGAGDR